MTLTGEMIYEWRVNRQLMDPWQSFLEYRNGWVRHGERLSHCRSPSVSFPFASVGLRSLINLDMCFTRDWWVVYMDPATCTEVLVVQTSHHPRYIEAYQLGSQEMLYRTEARPGLVERFYFLQLHGLICQLFSDELTSEEKYVPSPICHSLFLP